MENEKYRSLHTGVKFNGHTYFCALEFALELIGGKWKATMLSTIVIVELL